MRCPKIHFNKKMLQISLFSAQNPARGAYSSHSGVKNAPSIRQIHGYTYAENLYLSHDDGSKYKTIIKLVMFIRNARGSLVLRKYDIFGIYPTFSIFSKFHHCITSIKLFHHVYQGNSVFTDYYQSFLPNSFII